MATFIFLTNQYLPKPGATGVCIHQLAKVLAAENHDVHVVCYADGEASTQYEGLNIHKINMPPYLKDSQNSGPFLRKMYHAGSLLSKLIHIRDYPLRSATLVRRYVAAAESIMAGKESVKLVASYTPLEAAVAAAKLKKKYGSTIRTAFYSTDTLSNEQGAAGILPPDYRKKCGIRWEEKLFSVFDKILIMECHQAHYLSEPYRPFQEKMEIVNFPLFTKMECHPQERREEACTSLAYAGTLYRVLRNPGFLCDCLVALSRRRKIKADFLGSGDCEDIVQKACADSGGAVCFHGMQPHSVALTYLSTADVLLSIGNAESPMAPSKIYEYMSTGKPILHVYSWAEDPCLEPLTRYGNALLIQEGDPEAVVKMEEFLNHRKVLAFSDVARLFHTSTPEYTTHILESM